jgi:hypothetical protein
MFNQLKQYVFDEGHCVGHRQYRTFSARCAG